MADRSSQLVLSALTRAAADAAGLPLHASRTSPGLFPNTALGKQAAQRCQEEGYLHPVGSDKGSPRTSSSHCTITDKGLTYLLEQACPRQVLEDCVRILEERESSVATLVSTARQMQASIESLRSTISATLTRLGPSRGSLESLFVEFHQREPTPNGKAPVDLGSKILSCLERWARVGAHEDCPLPGLYRQITADCPSLTIGQFHDHLRQLVSQGRVWLHPWTGPLYEIPEAPFALLVGHEVAYYASLRKDEG